LFEKVASLPNLAAALLRVASNEGAPGVDGLSVAEVVEHAPQLLPKIQRALLQGNFIPEGTRVSTEEGTPQGGPRSPLLSNIVLDGLD